MKLSVIPVTNVEDMSNIPLPLISLTIWNESKKKLEEFLNNNDGTFRHIYNDSSVNVRAVKNIADNDPDMIYLRYGFNKLERKLKAELKLMQFEVRENCYPIMSNYPNLNKAPYFYVQIYYKK